MTKDKKRRKIYGQQIFQTP